MKTINVLLITARADTGGGPKHVNDLAEYIQEHYKNINLFIASPDDKPFANHYKKFASAFFTLPHRKFSVLSLLKLRSFCKKNKINIVHSHGRGAGIYSRLLFLLSAKIIHTYHGVHKESGLKDLFKNIIERFLKRFTNAFIFVSNSELTTAELVKLTKKDHNYVIPNGIDIDKIRKLKSAFDRQQVRKTFGIKDNEMVLGTLTRLDWQKGNDILINHFSNLTKQHPDKNLKLLIAGEGSEKHPLLDLISRLNLSNQVALLGSIGKPLEFLHGIDIFVSASRGEGMPYALIEALSMETKIIASKVTGHSDLLPEDNLFNLNNFESFSAKIDKIQKEKQSTKIQIDVFELGNSVKKIISTYQNQINLS